MAAGGDEVNSAMAFRCTIVNASAAIFQRDLLERAIDASAGFKMCGDWMVYLHLLQMGASHITSIPGIIFGDMRIRRLVDWRNGRLF